MDNQTVKELCNKLPVMVVKRHSSLSPIKKTKQTPPSVSERRSQSSTCSSERLKISKYAESEAAVSVTKTELLPEKEKEKTDTPIHPRTLATLTKTLTTKKREFLKTRKDFIAKQNSLIENFVAIKNLENRIGVSSEDLTDNIRLVTLSKWPVHDLLMLLGDDPPAPPVPSEINGVIGPQSMQQIIDNLNLIPDEVMALGAEIISRRQAPVTSLHNKHGPEKISKTNLKNSKAKVKEPDENEILNSLISATVKNIKSKMNTIIYLAKMSWLDRDKLFKKIERLEKKIIAHKRKLEENKSIKDDVSIPPGDGVQNPEVLEELKKERAARDAMKETLFGTENALRVARIRVTNLEKTLKETRTELDVLRQKLRGLEQLYRNRETSYDTRSKKLLELSKNGEVTIETLTKQRDALENRVRELRGLLDSKENHKTMKENEMEDLIESLKAEIAGQMKCQESTEQRCRSLEAQVQDLKATLNSTNEKSMRLVEMQQRYCMDYLPTKENEPSIRETELWNELQAVRTALAHAKEEQRQTRLDKDCFLNSLAKIAQEGASSIEDRMASELLDREKKIYNLENVIQEQKKTEEIMKKRIIQYENQLTDFKLEVKTLRNYDIFNRDVPYHDLQTELLDLQMKVSQLTRERSALMTAVATRALMLERHERAADLFARITRLRRDLQSMIDSPTRTTVEYSLSEVTCSLSTMCASAAETWTALRAERARVLRLERAILVQSHHLEREGRIRTQLEKRRANLERQVLTLHTAASDNALLNSNSNYADFGHMLGIN